MLLIRSPFGVGKKVCSPFFFHLHTLKSLIKGINVACTVASEDRIFRALFRPDSEMQFVSAGVKHLKFWSVAGNTLISKKALIKTNDDGRRSAKMSTMLSIAFAKVICQDSSNGFELFCEERANLHGKYDGSNLYLATEYIGKNG
jgi:hypothetical protein